jgi:regulatory protein
MKPPLDPASLSELAWAYAARYATTEAKLRRYLAGKLRERGWVGEADPDLSGVIGRLAETRAVDDRAFAEAKSAAMARRGLGPRRVRGALHAAGVAKTITAELDGGDTRAAAEAYARRRRLGCHRERPGAPDQQRRDLAAMLRAGHSWADATAALGGINPDLPEG